MFVKVDKERGILILVWFGFTSLDLKKSRLSIWVDLLSSKICSYFSKVKLTEKLNILYTHTLKHRLNFKVYKIIRFMQEEIVQFHDYQFFKEI